MRVLRPKFFRQASQMARRSKPQVCRSLMTAGLALSLGQSALAGINHYDLAAQLDYNGDKGFFLTLENQAPDGSVAKLQDIKIDLAFADGQTWHFAPVSLPWQFGHEYHVTAVVHPNGSELFVDGKKVAGASGTFAPLNGDLAASRTPGDLNAPTDYLVVQSGLRLSGYGLPSRAYNFATAKNIPIPVLLFSTETPQAITNWSNPNHPSIRVETTFHFEHLPNAHKFAPLIDKYGQNIYAHWPAKVKSDADLKTGVTTEQRRMAAWGVPAGFDAFGGDKKLSWRQTGTGYYRTAKHNGRWWFIDPQGYPCFYIALDTVDNPSQEYTPITGREDLFQQLPPQGNSLFHDAWATNHWGEKTGTEYVSFANANAARKYGAHWQNSVWAATLRRMAVWNFSGSGKWATPRTHEPRLTYVPVLSHSEVPNVGRHPDIFDPSIQQQIRAGLHRQMAASLKDPRILGWSYGNEYNEVVTTGEISDILKKGASVPAKQALVNYALIHLYGGDLTKLTGAWKVTAATAADLAATTPTPSDADIEQLRRFYADRYYGFIYKTVKQIDPNHLFLGWWVVPNWWQNEQDWLLQARHVDVVGYDNYAEDFADPSLMRLIKQANKPIFCGEFSFAPTYRGERGFGFYHINSQDDADAGRKYVRWMNQATHNPYCVGLSWFEYRDQSLTGRGPGQGPDIIYNEHYAFGLVDDTDQPKWALVEQVRAANLTAAKIHNK